MAQLDDATAAPILLITAPAGWGKTTLISSWIRSGKAPDGVVYRSFDSTDDGRPPVDLGDLVDRARGTPDDQRHDTVTVVLDNVHRAGRASMAAIRHLLDTADDRVKVILISRVDPPLPLYRWRLTGRLSEIRADQLSFTADETEQLLRAWGLHIRTRVLRRLHEVTEGWPAALALAGTAMRNRSEPESVLDDLWTDSGITGYLRHEVLRQLPANLREVLLRLSVVDRVCPGLIEALTGRRDGARILVELERRTGVVRHCGGPDSWYRCNEMVRLILQAEARQRFPEQIAQLHRAASDWYTVNHLPADGLAHALLARDWGRAKSVLYDHWPEILISRGFAAGGSTLTPADEMSADPLLALAWAVHRRNAGDLAGMRLFLRAAEAAGAEQATGQLPRILDAMRIVDALFDGDAERVITLADRLTNPDLDSCAGAEETVNALALCAVAHARLMLDELTEMDRAAEAAVALARWTGSTGAHLTALGHMATGDLVQGRLSAAEHRARLVLSIARNAGITRGPDVSLARLLLAYVALQRGQPDDAAYHLNLAAPGDLSTCPQIASGHTLALAGLHQMRGEPARGVEVLRTAYEGYGGPALVSASAALLEAELHLALGDASTAWRLLSSGAAGRRAQAWSAVVEARLLLAERKPEQALALWHDTPDREPPLPTAIETCLVRAQALFGVGDAAASWREVERAIQLAEPERIYRPFLVNPDVKHLLASHLSGGTAFNETLLGLVGSAHPLPPSVPTSAPARLVEPLTEREFVVLHYLNSTLSIGEIASALSVSANTVKTHTKNVYRKLDVSRRREAVRRGHELGFR